MGSCMFFERGTRMSKRLIAFGLGVVVLCVILSGCAGDLMQTNVTFTMDNASKGADYWLINSSKQTLAEQQQEVVTNLVSFLDNGDDNITEVDLTYIDKYLVSAVVYWDPSNGKGNQLRVKLISSNHTDVDQIQTDVQKQEVAFRQTGANIYKTLPVFLYGKTVAVSVWYWAS